MHEHRTNINQLQNSSESSLRDKFERNFTAFTRMSIRDLHHFVYCSGSFSFLKACRKKPRESEIHQKPVENKPHKNIMQSVK